MSRITVKRSIAAPVERVFRTVADIREFSQALPHVVRFEFLTDEKIDVGTRFRETRVMNDKEITTELEVTEYVENDHVRFVADSNGTIWDTVFTVRAAQDGAELEMIMDARAYKLLPKLMYPLIKGMVAKAVGRDMDLVKEHCEQA